MSTNNTYQDFDDPRGGCLALLFATCFTIMLGFFAGLVIWAVV